MAKIVYTRGDGGVSVVTPAEGGRLAFFITLASGTKLPSGLAPFTARPVDQILRRWPVAGAVAEWAESEAEWLARVQAKSVPADATNVQTVDDALIPDDRTFRNAWRKNGTGVTVDMVAARALARDMLRQERAALFAELDGQWMRATGRGEVTAAADLEAQRETLRDWPQDARLASASTPEALKTALTAIKADI